MPTLRRSLALAATGLGLAGLAAWAVGQSTDPPPPPSLKTVAVPAPPDLGDYVRDRAAAIQLGKALFWDMQIGSDGRTACASCHFAAGADSRSINQLNPGSLVRDLFGSAAPDTTIDRGANAWLRPEDFPLRLLSDPANRASGALRDSNDVVSSQGAFNTRFLRALPGEIEETVVRVPDPVFQVRGFNVRQVQPRHAPSVINAVFNHRNGWDGAAQNVFNGVNQWGDRDPKAQVLRVAPDGSLVATRVRLTDSSLASQSVAPIVNPLEMSSGGRTPADIANKLLKSSGKKLGPVRPLGLQRVHPEDSVLGEMSRWPDTGIKAKDYDTLIQRAFRPEWWQSSAVVRQADDGEVSLVARSGGKPEADDEFRLIEFNFPLFFGLALQMYQATLVSDDTPYDRWREGRGALSPQALLGLEVFLAQTPRPLPGGGVRAAGRCINCHAGAEFTDASVGSIRRNGITRLREGQDLDRGFNNIGVRPTLEDVGVGGHDPWGQPLSLTRNAPPSGRYVAVDGAVKAPGLRNVELTAPYFRNGGHHTLESAVQLYSRGGDWPQILGVDGVPIQPLTVPRFSAEESDALVAFLRSLTDERVRRRQAPFDHPQLFVPHGQIENERFALPDPLRLPQAVDRMREIPAVGRSGGAPLAGFMQWR